MVRNKIDKLNEKPILRAYVFQKKGDEQIKKELEDLEKEMKEFYEFNHY